MNSTPDQIQAMIELIAKLLGWKKMCCDNQLKYPHWHVKEQCFLGGGPPNWPGDQNASYKLPPSELDEEALGLKMKEAFDYYQPSVEKLISAYYESLFWLYVVKGYRWVECENMCVDGLYQPTPDPESTTKCPCSGQGGKFVKEKP